MSESRRPTRADETDEIEDTDRPERDPQAASTWDTIGGTEDIDDLTDEEELEDLMVEPTAGDLGILADTDVPGRPG
jgi:hypothetical protein